MGYSASEIFGWEIVEVSGVSITVGTALAALAIILVTLFARRLLGQIVRRAFELRQIKDEGIINLISNLTGYAVLAIGLSTSLSTLGIDLGAVFAAGAVFAVGIGFALQGLAQNFVSGIILMLERSIKPGDVIEVDGQTLQVVHLGIRSTLASGRDGENVLIPNSTIVQNIVRNRSHTMPHYRVRASVGVAYSSDLDVVEAALTRAADSLDEDIGPSQILLLGFGSSSVDYEVAVWTADPWDERRFRGVLNRAIWDALAESKVVIAFPQMDVHFDGPVVEAISAKKDVPESH